MDYEKKYKEALERARDFKNGEIKRELEIGENIMEYVFPELKESEDERIRKEIIKYFKKYQALSLGGYNVQDILAWLEKQDGQPKRGVQGDYKEALFKIASVLSQHEDKEGSPLEQIRSIVVDASLSAMDLEKKELKKIEQKPTDEEMKTILQTEYEKGRADAIAEMQKPSWSEEDEKITLSIEQIMNCASLLNIVPDKVDKIRTWLKSLKDRVQQQPKQKWSEDDLECELSCFENALFTAFSDAWQSYLQGEEVNIEQWAKEHSKELLEAAKEEYEKQGEQNTWKPSDEHLKALKDAIHIKFSENPSDSPLWRLYEQLKKLKGE